MFDCGFTKEDNWFRYRAGAIIIEDGCVLFAGNEHENYYYSIGGGVHMGTADTTSTPSAIQTADATSIPSVAPTIEASPVPSETPTTKTYTFRNDELLQQHFEKHGKDMGYAIPEDYVLGANWVIASPEALHKLEAEDGDDVYYLERTNEFVIVSTDGYIRTYFLPDSGINYFNKQSRRVLYYELRLHRYQQMF